MIGELIINILLVVLLLIVIAIVAIPVVVAVCIIVMCVLVLVYAFVLLICGIVEALIFEPIAWILRKVGGK